MIGISATKEKDQVVSEGYFALLLRAGMKIRSMFIIEEKSSADHHTHTHTHTLERITRVYLWAFTQ